MFKTSTTCNSSNWPGSNHTTSFAFVFRSINGGGGQKSYHVFLRLFLWSERYSNQSPRILFWMYSSNLLQLSSTGHCLRDLPLYYLRACFWHAFVKPLHKYTTYLKMNSLVIVQSQILYLISKVLELINHAHFDVVPVNHSRPICIPTVSFPLIHFLSKMIFSLQSINKKFQPCYFSICMLLLTRLIIKLSCPLFTVSPAEHWI